MPGGTETVVKISRVQLQLQTHVRTYRPKHCFGGRAALGIITLLLNVMGQERRALGHQRRCACVHM